MRRSDLRHLDHLVIQLAQTPEQLTRSDFVSLLILARDPSPRFSVLKDLGHSVAHDNRDRGITFDYLEKFAKRVRVAMTHGGHFQVSVAFPIDEIIRELNALLRSLGGTSMIDASDPDAQRALARGIALVLDGTEFELKGARAALELVQSESGPSYTLTIWFRDAIHGTFNVEANTGLSFPWMLVDGIAEPRRTVMPDNHGIDPARWLTPAQVSEITGFAVTTLANWRNLKKGPRFVRLGRSVRYSREEIDRFMRGDDGEADSSREA